MVILRFIALILMAVALMVLGADIVETLQPENAGKFSPHSVGELWELVHKGSFESLKGEDGGFIDIALKAPAFAVFGILGIVLAFLFRRRDY